MAFFDDLSKKLSSAKQDMAQNTQNYSNISKLNRTITEDEKKIEALYSQIGKTYYELNASAAAEKFAEPVAAITAALAAIENCKEQIKAIKGVANCPNCGAEVPYTSAFCNSCGTKMPPRPVAAPAPAPAQAYAPAQPYAPVQAPAQPYAPVQAPAQAYAPAQPFAPAPEAPAQTFAPAPAPEAPAAAADDSVQCPTCGASVPAGFKFCTSCGNIMEIPGAFAEQAPADTKICPYCGKELTAAAVFCTGCGHQV